MISIKICAFAGVLLLVCGFSFARLDEEGQTGDLDAFAEEDEAALSDLNERSQVLNASIKTDADQTLLDIDFIHDFDDKFDPRLESSASEWLSGELTKKPINTDETETENGKVIADHADFVKKKYYVDMVSMPFSHWLPQSAGINATLSAHDGTVRLKKPQKIGSDEVLGATLRFACETFGTENYPYSDDDVADAFSDPRLASCAFSLSNDDASGLTFGFLATNKVVWGVYGRQAWVKAIQNGNHKTFKIYRKLAARAAPSKFIDSRLEIDGHTQTTRYYLDDKLVWSVSRWGVLTNKIRVDAKNRIVSESDGRSELVNDFGSVRLYIGNQHQQDVADPNSRLGGRLALVRYTARRGYYSRKFRAWDEKSKRKSSLFNQGCATSLGRLRLVVKRVTGVDDETENQNKRHFLITQ